MSIISIRTNRPRLHPLGSRKRHYEPAVQAVCPVFVPDVGVADATDNLGATEITSLGNAPDRPVARWRKSVKLLCAIFFFAAIYLCGMFDQVPSTNSLTSFENNLFVLLAPAILLAVGGINTYGLLKSRRANVQSAHNAHNVRHQ